MRARSRSAGRLAQLVTARRRVAAGYQRAAAGYDAAHGDARSQARFAIIERPMLAATEGAERVLEIGCGTGRLLSQVRAPVRVGIDIAPAMLAQARAHIDHVALADAHCLPFAAGSFEAIVAGKGVFRYLDYRHAFAECARVLAPGGRLAIHQYPITTWSMRTLLFRGRPRAAASQASVQAEGRPDVTEPTVTEVDTLTDLYRPAVCVGLYPVGAWLWRSVRLRPYVVTVPKWLPGRLWSHCVVVFSKR